MSKYRDAQKVADYLEEAERRGIKHSKFNEVFYQNIAGTCGCVYGVIAILEGKGVDEVVSIAVRVLPDLRGDDGDVMPFARESEFVDRADMHAIFRATPAWAWEANL